MADMQGQLELTEGFVALLDNLNDAIAISVNQTLVHVNKAHLRMYGLQSADEVIGKPVGFASDPENQARLREVNAALRRGQQPDGLIEYTIRRPSGETRFIQATSLSVTYNGQPAIVGIMRDVTELLEQQEELRRANHELEAFSYSVSHDLRAPLRAIDGFSRILTEEHGPELSAEAQRYLGIIRANVGRMGKLVDDLLTLSRLGRQPISRRPVAMGGLVRQALDELGQETRNRNIQITVGDLPDCQADPSLLKQALVNLLSNAIKYTRRRDVATIEIGNFPEPERPERPVYFVRDNGVGFDMRYYNKLFGVFQRLHSAEEYEGTGVGLAIVQQVIQRHGGRVWGESEVDKGATFYFTLGGTA